jgi:hypothetical protein
MTKLDKLKATWAAGDRIGALRIAAKFPELGADAKAIKRAWECAAGRGAFYLQLGFNPDAAIAAGLHALAARYGLPQTDL